jgi:hypothetical protein
MANISGSSDAGNAASSAFSGGSVTGAMTSFLSTVTSAISSIFPNPQGSQLNNSTALNWRLPNNYTGSNATNTTTVNGTSTVMCNEAPQDGSIFAVISDIFSFVGSLV